MLTSIQQAAANAFAEWLGQKLPDVVVEPRWPAADKEKPAKSITVIPAGARRDIHVDARLLKNTPKATGTEAVWQIAACTQPFQLDVWALQDVDRDDILARLDTLLKTGEKDLVGVYNPDPFGAGVLLAVGDGWEDTTADFDFGEPDLEDLPDNVGRNIYRASFRGNANFMLTVTTTTARQKFIHFKLAVDSSTLDDTYTFQA